MLSPRGRIIGLQEERVLAYDNWEAKFQSFCLPDSKEELYAQVVRQSARKMLVLCSIARVRVSSLFVNIVLLP
jgi:hypothetical protein